jgi:hypothetical protein
VFIQPSTEQHGEVREMKTEKRRSKLAAICKGQDRKGDVKKTRGKQPHMEVSN